MVGHKGRYGLCARGAAASVGASLLVAVIAGWWLFAGIAPAAAAPGSPGRQLGSEGPVPGPGRPGLTVPPVEVPGLGSSGAGVGQEPALQTGLGAEPGPAYWLAGSDGGVFPFGRGAYEGGMAGRAHNAALRGLAVTPSGTGYWLAGADGGVFAFGDAKWMGAVASRQSRGAVVAITSTPTGRGYWLADADGGVFAFGDAPFLGAVATLPLAAPIVALAATPSGHGYWLAGADGGVFAFGDAPFLGRVASPGGLAAPVVGLAATPTGRGYWLAGADGGVFAFGDAVYAGGIVDRPHLAPVVGVARTRSGRGYWLAGADGGVFAFGDAVYLGSIGGTRLAGPVAAIASGDGIAVPANPKVPASIIGFDVSWPQCNTRVPAPPYGFAVVGLNDGDLFSANPCLRGQWDWARTFGSFGAVYVNTDAPATAAEFAQFARGVVANCGPNTGCTLDRWGRAGARDALTTAAAAGVDAPFWWLDVETGNEWLPDPAANAVVLRAMIDELSHAGKHVGIYSTTRMWSIIAGAYAPHLPVWVPGAPPQDAQGYCAGHGFGGGPTWMVQTGDGEFDVDVLCAGMTPTVGQSFAAPKPVYVPVYGSARQAPSFGTGGTGQGAWADRGWGDAEARVSRALAVLAWGPHRAHPHGSVPGAIAIGLATLLLSAALFVAHQLLGLRSALRGASGRRGSA